MSETVSVEGWNCVTNVDRWLEVSAYCDRWCERCRHRHRCLMAGAAVEELLEAEEAPEADTEELDVLAMLSAEDCASLLLHFDDDPILTAAKDWGLQAFAWLDTQPSQRSWGELEVLRWHATLVPAKLSRACTGLLHETPLHRSQDARGSAKVAAMGLEACVGVLTLRCERRRDPGAMALLGASQSLLDRVRERFPGCMGFVRPGFDEGERSDGAAAP
jgi:hypothetical protein